MQSTSGPSPSKSSQRDDNIIGREPTTKLTQSQSTLSIQSLLKNPFRGRGYSSSSQHHLILQDPIGSPTKTLPTSPQLLMSESMKETTIQESEYNDYGIRQEVLETQESSSAVKQSNDLTLEEYREELRRAHKDPLLENESPTGQEEQDIEEGQLQKITVAESKWPFWYSWTSNTDQSVTAPEPSTKLLQDLQLINDRTISEENFQGESINFENHDLVNSTNPLVACSSQENKINISAKSEIITSSNRRASWFGWRNSSTISIEDSSKHQIIQKDLNKQKIDRCDIVTDITEEDITTGTTFHKCGLANQEESIGLNKNLKTISKDDHVLDCMPKKATSTGTWWNPLSWNMGPVPSQHPETISSTEESRKAANYVRLQSANNQKTSSWGYYKTLFSDSIQDENESTPNGGQVSIIGTFTAKNPINIDHLPRSQFEVQESNFDLGTAANTSLVLPNLDYNYRELTMRTKSRILLSSLRPLNKLFLEESHLYHLTSQKTYSHGSNGFMNERKSETVKKKAIVIGIHGFYPIKFIKTLLGESTHTASEMVEIASKQLIRWSKNNDIEIDIETIALEGYGKIFERTSGVLSLLDNWIESISNCDYLFIVSHSEGVSIAVHIASRLTTAGYLDEVSKIGLINISGICMGPFSGLDSKLSIKAYSNFEKDMLLELFDFQDPESLQSREFIRHLKILIARNIKLTFIGSINDQLVPIYSSLNIQIKHPNIYRAIYIDGDTYQSDFVVSLLNLLLMIKNLNYDDHDLLIELSSFLAGTPNRPGHSRILEDGNVYMEGIKNTLETSDLIFQKPVEEQLVNVKDFNINQYHIPWCLRGFLQELPNLKHFDHKEMVEQLLKEYREWEPSTKQQKELKFCIEILGNMNSDELYI